MGSNPDYQLWLAQSIPISFSIHGAYSNPSYLGNVNEVQVGSTGFFSPDAHFPCSNVPQVAAFGANSLCAAGYDSGTNKVFSSTSTNGGSSFGARVTIASSLGIANGKIGLSASPDGTTLICAFAIANSSNATLMVAVSTNGGASWSVKTVGTVTPNNGGSQSSVSYNASCVARNGGVWYAVWGVQYSNGTTVGSVIYGASTTNSGATWSSISTLDSHLGASGLVYYPAVTAYDDTHLSTLYVNASNQAISLNSVGGFSSPTSVTIGTVNFSNPGKGAGASAWDGNNALGAFVDGSSNSLKFTTTANRGATWTALASTGRSATTGVSISAVALGAAAWFIGYSDASDSGPKYVESFDSGSTWTLVPLDGTNPITQGAGIAGTVSGGITWTEAKNLAGLTFDYMLNQGGQFSCRVFATDPTIRGLLGGGTIFTLQTVDASSRTDAAHTVFSGILTDAKEDKKTHVPGLSGSIVWDIVGKDWILLLEQWSWTAGSIGATVGAGTDGKDFEGMTTDAIASLIVGDLITAQGVPLISGAFDLGPTVSAYFRNRRAKWILLDLAMCGGGGILPSSGLPPAPIGTFTKVMRYLWADLDPTGATLNGKLNFYDAGNARFLTTDPTGGVDASRVIDILKLGGGRTHVKDCLDIVSNKVSIQYGGFGSGAQRNLAAGSGDVFTSSDAGISARQATSVSNSGRREAHVTASYLKDSASATPLQDTILNLYCGGNSWLFQGLTDDITPKGVGMAQILLKQPRLFRAAPSFGAHIGDIVGVTRGASKDFLAVFTAFHYEMDSHTLQVYFGLPDPGDSDIQGIKRRGDQTDDAGSTTENSPVPNATNNNLQGTRPDASSILLDLTANSSVPYNSTRHNGVNLLVNVGDENGGDGFPITFRVLVEGRLGPATATFKPILDQTYTQGAVATSSGSPPQTISPGLYFNSFVSTTQLMNLFGIPQGGTLTIDGVRLTITKLSGGTVTNYNYQLLFPPTRHP